MENARNARIQCDIYQYTRLLTSSVIMSSQLSATNARADTGRGLEGTFPPSANLCALALNKHYTKAVGPPVSAK